MRKVLFQRKAYREEIIPNDEFVVEKVIELENSEFESYLDDILEDKDFIEENIDLMYVDDEDKWHAILVTSKEADFGILVQSEGYSYARYSAYVLKKDVGL